MIEGDEIGQKEFLRRLPAQTQLIVRFQTDLFTLEQLAHMADRLASVPVMHDCPPTSQPHTRMHHGRTKGFR